MATVASVASVGHMGMGMGVVGWLGVRVLRVERGAGSVAHGICHVGVGVVSIARGAVHVGGRSWAVVVFVGAVVLTGVEASIASGSIGLGLALFARVVGAAAVDVLGKEGSKVVLEALCFLEVELFLCLLCVCVRVVLFVYGRVYVCGMCMYACMHVRMYG